MFAKFQTSKFVIGFSLVLVTYIISHCSLSDCIASHLVARFILTRSFNNEIVIKNEDVSLTTFPRLIIGSYEVLFFNCIASKHGANDRVQPCIILKLFSQPR